jgi:carboxypeptidase C (cathepsin A)
VEQFAMGEYARALAAGSELPPNERSAIAEKLHQYTGLPVDYILKADLRIDGGEFRQNLQSDGELTTGRLDSRFSGPDIDPLSQRADYDPQATHSVRPTSLHSMSMLARSCAMVTPGHSRRVSSCSVPGISATSFYQGIYEMHHLPIPQNLQANIEYCFYSSGHMVYAKDASLRQLHDNVADFIRRTGRSTQ